MYLINHNATFFKLLFVIAVCLTGIILIVANPKQVNSWVGCIIVIVVFLAAIFGIIKAAHKDFKDDK
jgi:uncharacterized membrane protein